MRRNALFLGLFLAGCGGGNSSFLEGSSGSVALAFTAGSGYGGSVSPLNRYDRLTGSVVGNALDATVTFETRRLSVAALADPLATGTVIDLSAGTASSVDYQDANGRWSATSGTLTVDQRTANSVRLTLTNVALEPAGNGATGVVAVDGTLTVNTG